MYNYIYNTYIYIYIYYTRTFIYHCHKYLHIYIYIYANQLQVYVCRISATGLPLKKLRMAAIWFRHGPWNTNRPTINISLLDSAIHPCIWLTSGPSMKEMVWHHPKVYFCRRWEEREREKQKFAAAVASGKSKKPRKHPLATENTEKIVYDSSQMWGVFPLFKSWSTINLPCNRMVHTGDFRDVPLLG